MGTTIERFTRRLQAGQPATDVVFASPAIAHVEGLLQHGRDLGVSVERIARCAGISKQALYRQLSRSRTGTGNLMDPAISARLRAVTVRAAAAADPLVPAVGSRRRVQALLVMGHDHDRQTAECGVITDRLLARDTAWTTRSTHDAVAAMYRRLTLVKGRSDVCAAQARAWGYASPMAWEEGAIDDPHAEPEPEPGAARGTWPRDDLLREVELLVSGGSSVHDAAKRLGMEQESVRRQLRRAGRHDLIRALMHHTPDRRTS